MTFSQKSLFLTLSLMALLFFVSSKIYISRHKPTLPNEERLIEIELQQEAAPSEEGRENLEAKKGETEKNAKLLEETLETHAAFNENESIGEGSFSEGDSEGQEETIGEKENLQELLVNYTPQMSEELASLISASREKISSSHEKLSGEGEIVKKIRQNRQKTTIKYNMEGRKITYIMTPAYTCVNGGTVVVDITVSSSGRVIEAVVNDKESTATLDDCLVENALKYSKEAVFDISSEFKQKGTISFTYIPK